MPKANEKTIVQGMSGTKQISRPALDKLEATSNQRSLQSLFEPRGVAVVGATSKPSLAKSILNNIILSSSMEISPLSTRSATKLTRRLFL